MFLLFCPIILLVVLYKYIIFSIKELYRLLEKLYNYQDGKTNKNGIPINESKKPYEKVIDFISQYKYLIGGIVIVAFTTGIVIRVIKIKKQRELGL